MGNIRLYGSTSGYTELAPPAVAPDGVLSLPIGTGTLATQASVGLVKIVDQSFTAASSVSVNNCFTSAYENYRIIMDCTSVSANGETYLRFRASGSDTTSSNYAYTYYQNRTPPSSATGYDSASGVAFGRLVYAGSGYKMQIMLDFINPGISSEANYRGRSNSYDGGYQTLFNYGICTASVVHDGFTIYRSSGTITGTIRVYGYQN